MNRTEKALVVIVIELALIGMLVIYIAKTAQAELAKTSSQVSTSPVAKLFGL